MAILKTPGRPKHTRFTIAADTDVYKVELALEQRQVDRCYERLEELRAQAKDSLQKNIDRSTDTPQSVFEREVFASYSRHRLQAVSASEHQLVFGRLDSTTESGPLYIGRIGMADESHHRMLVDWRAPAGSAFYRATARMPQGVVRRRTLITRGKQVVDMNDDLLQPDLAGDLAVVAGEGALLHALLKKRGPFMQDIVATIQADQDRIIRTDPKASVILTGGPGTGKSVVALHRTAYLMYERSAELERRGVLVLGPGTRFSRYISRVLPSLGETSVSIKSVFDLLDGATATGREDLGTARTKGNVAMAKVLKSWLVASYPEPAQPLGLTIEGSLLRISPGELRRVRTDALQSAGHGFNASRHRVLRKLAGLVLRKTGRPRPRTRELKDMTHQLLDEARVVDLLESLLPHRTAQRAFLELRADAGRLRDLLRRHFPPARCEELVGQLAGTTEILVDDLPLVDELDWLLGPIPTLHAEPDNTVVGYERYASSIERLEYALRPDPGETSSADYGHIVVDEAQDLTPMQWRMLARRGPRASWTVVADPRQATLSTPEDFEAALARTLKTGNVKRFALEVNYRTPKQIMHYAAEASGLDMSAVSSVREGEPPRFFNLDGDPVATVAAAANWLDQQPGSGCFVTARREDVAVVEAAQTNADVLWALDAKGLEFDNVVLFRPEALDATRPEDASLVLIGATRATQRLAVVSGAPAAADPRSEPSEMRLF